MECVFYWLVKDSVSYLSNHTVSRYLLSLVIRTRRPTSRSSVGNETGTILCCCEAYDIWDSTRAGLDLGMELTNGNGFRVLDYGLRNTRF